MGASCGGHYLGRAERSAEQFSGRVDRPSTPPCWGSSTFLGLPPGQQFARAFRRLAHLGHPPAPPLSCEQQNNHKYIQPVFRPKGYSDWAKNPFKSPAQLPGWLPAPAHDFHAVFHWPASIHVLRSRMFVFLLLHKPFYLIEPSVFQWFSKYPKVKLVSTEGVGSVQPREESACRRPCPTSFPALRSFNSCLLWQ